MTFELIHSEVIYTGEAFNVRKDLISLPNGRSHTYDIVEHNPSVTMIPVDSGNRILFIRQYRHAAGKQLLELPAGVLESGEDPLQGAQREIREEVGMSSRRMLKIGEFFLAPGYSTEKMYVFLALDLYQDPLPGDEDEILSVEPIPAPEALQLAETGQLEDTKTISALFLGYRHLIKNSRPAE